MRTIKAGDSLKYLEKYAICLNDKLKNQPIEVFCRDNEIEMVLEYLQLRKKSNPLLIGEAGVGKTAVVEGVVQRIINGQVPKQLEDILVFSLEVSSLMSKESSPEFLLKEIMKELNEVNGILFIDEIHTIVNTTDQSGGLDLSNALKPALSRGEIKVIGATTIEEYYLYLVKDRALTRRFNKINVRELTILETIDVLSQVSRLYEEHYNINIAKELLGICCLYAERFIHNNQFPDKALDVLDEACSISNFKGHRDLSEESIQMAIKQRTNITVDNLDSQESIQRLLHLYDYLKKRIKGQDNILRDVSDKITQSKMGLGKSNKPVASFMFLGTTGVGKTELAKALKDYLFPESEKGMFRFDMSEFSDPNTALKKLIGSSESDGILIKRIRENPYCILLFDEIEKAKLEDVYNTFLQILDEGRLTDRFGREVRFNHCIIIFTTNLGAKFIIDQMDYSSIDSTRGRLNFSAEQESRERIFNKKIENELRTVFKPELLNRIDQKLVFNILDNESIEDIIQLQLQPLKEKVEKEHIKLTIDQDKIIPFLIRVGFDKENGARPIERAITRYIQFPLAELLLKNRINERKIAEVLLTTKGIPPSLNDRYGNEEVRIRVSYTT